MKLIKDFLRVYKEAKEVDPSNIVRVMLSILRYNLHVSLRGPIGYIAWGVNKEPYFVSGGMAGCSKYNFGYVSGKRRLRIFHKGKVRLSNRHKIWHMLWTEIKYRTIHRKVYKERNSSQYSNNTFQERASAAVDKAVDDFLRDYPKEKRDAQP